MVVFVSLAVAGALVLAGDWAYARHQRRRLAAGAPTAPDFDPTRDTATNVQVVAQNANSLGTISSGGFGR